MRRRGELSELLPYWYQLGSLLPGIKGQAPSLLSELRQMIEQGESVRVGEQLQALWRSGFEGMMVPVGKDPWFQGYDVMPVVGDRLAVLSEGAELIGKLLVQEGEELALLPVVPPELPVGRLLSFGWSKGWLDLEWSKKRLRQMILRVEREGSVKLRLNRGVKEFRLRRSVRERGRRVDVSSSFDVCQGETLFLDRFEA